MSVPKTSATVKAKCDKPACYIEQQVQTCIRCKRPIASGEPRHSFMNFSGPIQNFHCKCMK